MKLGSLVLAVLVAGADFAAQGEEKTAQEAAAEARLRSLFTVSPDWYIPKSVDPQNDKLRLLLLAPGGPLLIEAQVRESGRPYAAFLEEQIDLVLKSADRDGDGKLSWKTEAVGMRLPTHRLALKEKEQTIWLAALDLDQDGFASRYELRRLLCLDGANTPLVVGSPQGSPLTAEACFQQLADQNGDGTLSADELDGLKKRLRLRDANDNELIDSYELLGAKVDAYRTGRRASAVALVWLHEDTDWDRLQKQLATSYGAQSSLGTGEPRLALLTAAVGGKADQTLNAAELRSLLTV